MDEELTPERGARDAADADVARAPARSAEESKASSRGGWGRLRDGLGDPAGFRTGEGGERASSRATDDDVTAQDGQSSLVELTGAAARSLRAATTGARLEPSAACRLSSSDVLAGFADIGEARARLEVVEQVLLGEVLSRGLAPEAGFFVPDFVRTALGRRAPLPEASTVAAAVQVARATAPVQEAGLGASLRDHVPGGDVVREAVFSTALSVGRAAQITRFAKDVAPVADEADLAEWVDGFVIAAADVLPPRGVESAEQQSDRGPDAPGAGRGADARQLHRALQQARLIVKPARDLEDDERRRRQGRAFTRTDGGCSATGMAHYRLTLDPEGAAIVDSAVAALSAPRRLEDGTLEPGETSDPRSAATRRADALLDLVSRAVSAGGGPASGSHGGGATDATQTRGHADDAGDSDVDGDGDGNGNVNGQAQSVDEPTGTPGLTTFGPLPGLGDKTQVLVTIDLLALTGMLDRAGITSTGEILSPATVRRLACEAGIIPAVLGADGQVLDLGRTRRLFTPGQRLIVWRRDKHCSYPGCTIPATWCDVHHVDWWSRGGPTDLANAALLCRRHHTFVHTHDLTATVTERGVTWHAPPPAPPPTPPPRR